MTLEAKITAVAANPPENSATVTLQMYDTATPATILWTGPIGMRLDAPPERFLDQLDRLFDSVDGQQQMLARLQNQIGRPLRRRP